VTGKIPVSAGLADIDQLRLSQPALNAARRYPMSASALADLQKESRAAFEAGGRGLAREAGGVTTTALGSGSIATAGTRAVSQRIGGGEVARAATTGPAGSLLDQSVDVGGLSQSTGNPLAGSRAAESTTARALEDIPAATLKPAASSATSAAVEGGDAARASARAASEGTAAAGKVASKVAVKEGEEVAAKVGGTAVAKGLVAGLGGGLDIYKDVNRGLQGEAVFGDNTLQKIGNIGYIVGSAMEIGGILTAWTGFGVGLEIAGAGISLASAGVEAAGDVKAAGDKESSVTDDITSEQRGQSAATRQTQVVARSN
jgi:hypothetical protein